MRTTRIVVTELPPNNVSAECWLIEWTDDLGQQKHEHHSKAAAQRHVRGLLQTVPPEMTKDEVLTVVRL